jgi:hypothetical protein
VKTANRTENTGSSARPILRTCGEVFADGSVLELVASSDAIRPNLLLSNRTRMVIASEVEYHGQLYRPEELDSSVLRATRLPSKPIGYGTIRHLLTELADTFEKFLAFSRSASELTSFWVLTSWFPDCLSSPPALWISGADIGRAASFLGLLHCLCRRALKVAGVTRSGFLSLPSAFRPTLLVNQPTLSTGLQNLWHESNYRGFCVPGSRGVVLDVSGSKAIFAGMAGATTRPSAGHLHVPLFPADRELPFLDELTLARTADYFLPRLLQYRLDHAKKVREARFAVSDLKCPTRDLASKLGACVQGDAELARRVIPLLPPEDDGIGQCNLDCAIIQVLWPRLHSGPTNANATRVKIEAELTAEVNTFLLSCGETISYSREEVGIRVASLELSRKRMNTGSILLLDSLTNHRVHQLARGYRIAEKVPGCALCQPVEKIRSDGVEGVKGV